MLDIELTGDKTTGTLTLIGDLTIQYMDRLKDSLMEALEKHSHVDVKIEAITAIDFSCLQLLCATHKSAEKSDKSVTVYPPKVGRFYDLLEYTGLSQEYLHSQRGEGQEPVRGFHIGGIHE